MPILRAAESVHRQKSVLTAIVKQSAIILLVAAGVFVIIGQVTDLDLLLADMFFDPVRHVFPLDHTWFARKFMHDGVKKVLVWSAYFLFAVILFDSIRPVRQISPLRRIQIRLLGLVAVLEPLLIHTLKKNSALHCPWGVDRYGGDAPFLRLFDSIPAGWSYGHCFPAGHASGGMWLSALAVLCLPHAPKKALAVFAGGLGIGLAMGWVQQMRGQHFLTHTLWTAWLSSVLFVAILALFSRRFESAVPQVSPVASNKPSSIGLSQAS